MSTKTYANRSNARRAAKAAGLENFEIVTIKQQADNGVTTVLYGYEAIAAATPEPAAPKAPRYRLVRRARKAAVAAAAPAAAPTQPTTGTEPTTLGAKKHKDFQLYGRSSAISPVKAVHDWLNANGQGISRKEALFQLSQLGINYATARTQYQKWFSANK